jgi:hypothetical protein
LGATTSVLIESTSQSTRACEIFSGQLSQLYCGAASASISLVAVGTGLPTTAASASTLPGTTADSNASFYSFAFFDRIAGDNAAPDTLYVADERAAASGGGIQKWSINGSGTWIFVGTFNRDLTLGVRGLAAHTSGSGITLIGTTAINSPSSNSNGNAIIRYFDDGATAPASAALTTLQPGVNGVAKVYRGVALAPHL